MLRGPKGRRATHPVSAWGAPLMVEEVLDQWYGPDDEFFKVRADDGNLYILRHQALEDEWSLESFRQTAR